MIIICWLSCWPSITVPLSAVFHIRYQVLSVFPPYSGVLLKVWKCRIQHKSRSIFWSFFAVWTLLWLGKSSVLAILGNLEDINMAVRSRQQHQVSNDSMIAAICCVVRLRLTRFKDKVNGATTECRATFDREPNEPARLALQWKKLWVLI